MPADESETPMDFASWDGFSFKREVLKVEKKFIERALRDAQQPAVARALGGTDDARERRSRTPACNELEQGALTFAQHDPIEGPQLEHELGAKSRFHAACDQQRSRGEAPRKMRKL